MKQKEEMQMRCPDCGSIMEILKSDCYIEEFDREEVIAHFYGYCGECKKTFAWDRFFAFDGDSEPERVD